MLRRDRQYGPLPTGSRDTERARMFEGSSSARNVRQARTTSVPGRDVVLAVFFGVLIIRAV
jgi:hypothetical protein